MSQDERKPIIVTVKDDALGEIHKLADDLKAKGMDVDRVMPITGVISGTCPTAAVRELHKLEGVLSVEEEAAAELSPPGGPQ